MTVHTPVAPPAPAGPPTPPRSRSLRIVLLIVGSALVLLLIGAAALQAVQSATAASRGADTGRYTASGAFTALEVDVSAAAVTVSYDDDVDEARFDFDSGGSSVRFEQRMLGDTLRVTVGDRGWWPVHLFDLTELGTATLDVTLPRGSDAFDLDIDSSAGGVRVDGDFGRLSLETSAGDLELAGSADSLELDSSAGSIRAEGLDVRGAVSAQSSAGDTELSFVSLPDALTVQSSAGEVRVQLPDGEYDIRTDTSLGTVEQGLRSTPGAERVYSFETSVGDLVLSPAR